MILFVENDDSFTWNVLELLPFPREAVRVVRAPDAWAMLGDASQVIVGPGPLDPIRARLVPLVQEIARRQLPFLGVCLGHQALGLAFGAELTRTVPAHGKRAVAHFTPSRSFPGVVGETEVMRYHSLSLTNVAAPLRVVGALADGTVMAIEHETLPMAGVQFHPDSFATRDGARFVGGRGASTSFAAAARPRAAPGITTSLPLSTLRNRTDFALLAPAFDGGDAWTMVDLTSHEPANCRVWHARAEGEAQALEGSARAVSVDFDVAPAEVSPLLADEGFRSGVEAIRTRIAAGDVYQVNLTLRAQLGNHFDGAALLTTMCRRGVQRFAAWVKSSRWGEFVSASPELLVARDGLHVRVEPMKGTAPVDGRKALERSEKDRAELAMITDLLRDDLHQLCERGSVRVTNERRFITLPYVVQTVADVEGTLRPEVDTSMLLQRIHPGGSVTGAPRPAALAEIARLERTPRGAYCGALGLERDSQLVTALLIRTAEPTDAGWSYGVGSGITWDSDPEAELAEVRAKLGVLSAR